MRELIWKIYLWSFMRISEKIKLMQSFSFVKGGGSGKLCLPYFGAQLKIKRYL